MRRLFIMAVTLAAVCLVVSLRPVSAQIYAPSGPQALPPTFSPWLNLFQRNTGPLDNYHTWVQPEMRLRQTLQYQARNIQSLQQYVSQPQTRTDGKLAPTGVGGGFMSYSHYYPGLNTSGGFPLDRNRRPVRLGSPSYFQPPGLQF
ncbi:MAG: hypothetical protein JXB10_13510 [Pirellulales bacterium]|nr:hypothetical protein [Pirellulales bacterium]